MQFARLIGILVVFGAPGIIGGGLVMHLSHSWVAVAIFEVLLIIGAVTVAFKAAGKPAPSEH